MIPTGARVVVQWETRGQRDVYGCPSGAVVSYNPDLRLYKVHHPAQKDAASCTLSYAREELAYTLREKIILAAQNNKLIERIVDKCRTWIL